MTSKKKNKSNSDNIHESPLQSTLLVVEDDRSILDNFSPDQNISSNLITQSKIYSVSFTPDNLGTLSKSNEFILGSTLELENEINSLKKEQLKLFEKLKNAETEVEKHKADKSKIEAAQKSKEEDYKKLETTNKEIKKKLNLGHLLGQVNDKARKKLFESDEFLNLFESIKDCESYVISIDIRRSTELMLKAKKPELFEKFIVSLCEQLSDKILNNFGIFDKFTGDGILAFFPTFFSGEQAGMLAVKSALECHSVFNEHYNNNRHCFISVLKDVGLGIGIDYGSTYLVRMNTYTVVGTPVVYACRMAGAESGDTLLNQPAYERIFEEYKQYFNFHEKSISIKNEGETIAYQITSNGESLKVNVPDWDKIIKNYKSFKN